MWSWPKCQLVVISVIKHVQQVPKERMHVVHLGEVLQYLCELVVPAALRELDLHDAQHILTDASQGQDAQEDFVMIRNGLSRR